MIIIAVIVFFIMLYIQDLGFNIPMFNIISLGIIFLAILIALGILSGKCQPSSWDKWDVV